MRKINAFCKVIALVIALISVLSIFASCQKEPQNDEEENKNLLDISGYAIVRNSKSHAKVTKKTASLKSAIEEKLGLDLAVAEDWYNPNNPPDLNAKEILIDKTNRKESQDALAKLEEKEGDAYIVEITENKIVIVGKTELSTMRAISYFINNYVIPSAKGNNIDLSHGKSVTEDYSAEKNIWITDKLDMDVVMTADIIKKAIFPAVIELQHQPNAEDNGMLVATASGESAGKSTLGYIMGSRDGGKTWKLLARPEEKIKPSVGWAGSMSHIYELPAQLGNLAAGTLIYSSNAVNYDRASHIGVWKSTDCGKTWSEISIVASGGGTALGVWEPYMLAHDGYLYCFYSDDSHPKYDQRIVYQRSKNGIQWEKAVPVCAFDNFIDRPGMPVITKMGNGEYFLVYEYCGSWLEDTQDCFVYYKVTNDITNWNPSDPGTRITAKYNGKDYITASSPSCVWTPAGGENGTLFVQGRREFGFYGINPMFVSFDYGKTWDTIEPPMPYNWYASAATGNDAGVGYRPILVVGADPSVIHYVNIIEGDNAQGSKVRYAKLKIYD